MKPKKYGTLWLRFDRTLSQDTLRQILILSVLMIVAFVASFVLLFFFGGNWKQYCLNKGINEFLFPLYLLIDGNAFSNFYMEKASEDNGYYSPDNFGLFLACLVYIAGIIIFTGMIISVMTNMIGMRVENYRTGHIHYLKSGHYIIMGYDEMVPSFISHILEKDKKAYVLVLTSAKVVEIKEKLSKSFNEVQMKQIIINYGHRTSPDFFKEIHLESAEQIYVVGNRLRSAHDAINVECVDSICLYLSRLEGNNVPKRITCVFNDLDTYASFKTSEIFQKVLDLNIEFVPYNIYAGWAKQVFVKRCYHDMENPDKEYTYPAVYGKGIGIEDNKYVHLVFVGTTNFAVAFAMEAAHVLHFPNYNRDNRLKTRITFIDINADREKDEFITRNRHFFEVQSYIFRDFICDVSGRPDTRPTYFNDRNGYEPGEDYDFLDVEFEFIKGDIFSREVQEEIDRWALAKEEQYLSLFLAQSDQRLNFVMGMNMPDSVYDNDVNIFIRQDRSDNFVTNLRLVDEGKSFMYSKVQNGELISSLRKGRYSHIYPFGMNETGFSEDNHSLKRAKLINYLYHIADYNTNKFPKPCDIESISEFEIWEKANQYWKDISVALKWSNLYSAYAIRTKLASLRAMRNIDLDDKSKDMIPLSDYEIEEMAKVEHNRWNVEKLLMGYRKPHRDEDKYNSDVFASDLMLNKKCYIHHDIRPFDKLDNISELDREFSRYIPWIMKMTEG